MRVRGLLKGQARRNARVLGGLLASTCIAFGFACAAVSNGDSGAETNESGAGRSAARESRGSSYTERSGGLELHMVWIPAGSFEMGSPPGEAAGRQDQEGPLHRVELDGFWIGAHEVTQEQWSELMGSNPSYFKRGGAFPVEQVSWNGAMEFCRKLSEKTGKHYALPTEAQWEYACRAGTSTPWSTGTSLDATQAAIVGTGNVPRAVGSFPSNPWGVYDMHGNLWEWCSDWFGDDYYAQSPPRNPRGPESGWARVVRGGSYLSPAEFTRAAYRNWESPGADYDFIGFRVVCEP